MLIREKKYLRLDCAADRPKLCEYYESQGFKKVREEGCLENIQQLFTNLKLLKHH
jgi:hypothetical protein